MRKHQFSCPQALQFAIFFWLQLWPTLWVLKPILVAKERSTLLEVYHGDPWALIVWTFSTSYFGGEVYKAFIWTPNPAETSVMSPLRSSLVRLHQPNKETLHQLTSDSVQNHGNLGGILTKDSCWQLQLFRNKTKMDHPILPVDFQLGNRAMMRSA